MNMNAKITALMSTLLLVGCDGPAIERDLTALPQADAGYRPSEPLELPPLGAPLPEPELLR